jgi:hypothetical protein
MVTAPVMVPTGESMAVPTGESMAVPTAAPSGRD